MTHNMHCVMEAKYYSSSQRRNNGVSFEGVELWKQTLIGFFAVDLIDKGLTHVNTQYKP